MRISDWSSDVCSSDLKANSGHPGAPMGMADIAEVLWRHFLRHNPANPSWPNRHRFVLSYGHGSMLLYSLQIGRASFRERVCQVVKFSVVAVFLIKKK